MKLFGSIVVDDLPMIAVLYDLKGSQRWFLFSKYRLDQINDNSDEKYENELTLGRLCSMDCTDYLLEAQVTSKKTGKVTMYKSCRRLDKIFRSLSEAKFMSYPKSEITSNLDVFEPVRKIVFSASHLDTSISYTQIDGLYTALEFSSNGISISMIENPRIKIPKKLEFVDCPKFYSEGINEVNINQISPDNLGNVVDLSWYWDLDTKVPKKDYLSIDNKKDFECKLITPLVQYISREKCKDKFPLVSCDTETSGLLLLDLSEGNPDKDHITTIQFSWKDDQGVIVFLDMKYFNNVDLKYAFERLAPLFKYRLPESQEFDYELYYDEEGNEVRRTLHLNRKKYKLVGHHSSFDSRATKSVGADFSRDPKGKFVKGWDTQFYFDHDTLQMAFNIDPTTTKKSKGLKKLTRYFFGDETPELSDLLGKGNEGKFSMLRSRQIAEIYGCADTDYTRKLFKPLRELMTDKMYKSYKQLDPISWYLTAGSEYYGLPLRKDMVSRNAKIIKEDLETIEQLIYSYVGSLLYNKSKMKSVKNFSLNEEEDLKMDLKLYHDKKYVFNIGGQDLPKIMYNMLHYPIMSRSKQSGKPSVDSYAMDKLLKEKLPKSSNVLTEDIYSCSNKYIPNLEKPEVLVSKDKFNSYVYPLCYLIKTYRTWNKEYTTYYKPFDENDLEGRIFKNISTTNIETRRFSCALQQTKTALKKATRPITEDFYMAGWDLAQAEPRTFTSLSGDTLGIQKLNDYEKDYHTENAAEMYNTPAYQVDKDSRKHAKVPGLGIPYGLQDRKLCERLDMEPTPENLITTRLIRKKFETAKQKEMAFLNAVRDNALNVVNVPVKLKRFWGIADDAKVGLVKNEEGFYRYFDLTDVLGDEYREDVVRRAAGNYPIQSFQADFYRLLIRRFHEELIRAGIRDKVVFHMYIHDELLFSVHKSVDPRLIAEIVTRATMIKLKGHTTYFSGLSFGDSWYDTHSGDYEIPVGLMYQIRDNLNSYTLQDWTDNPNDLIMPMIKKYQVDRFLEVTKSIEPAYLSKGLDIPYLVSNFTNYTVRSYVYDYKPCYKLKQRYSSKKNGLVDDDDDFFLSCLCHLLQENNFDSLVIQTENERVSVKDYISFRNEKNPVVMDFSDDDDNDYSMYSDFTNPSDNDFYVFNEEEFENHLESMYKKKSDDLEDLKIQPNEYKYLTIGNNAVVAKVRRLTCIDKVYNFLEEYKYSSGSLIILENAISSKRLKFKYDADLKKFDEFLAKLN